LGYLHIEVGRPSGGAVCEGKQDVHADSPAKCVPHPEQSASHICHRSELIRPYIPVMTFFGPESYGQKGKGKKKYKSPLEVTSVH
jgi:hypothetical protein